MVKGKSKAECSAPPAVNEDLKKIEESLHEFRQRVKASEVTDFNVELRSIQDMVCDAIGLERRPKTMATEQQQQQQSDASDEDDDEDKEVRDLINRRLTTFMLLALSFESKDSKESRDFYERMKQKSDLEIELILQPFSKDEIKKVNLYLKANATEAQRRAKAGR